MTSYEKAKQKFKAIKPDDTTEVQEPWDTPEPLEEQIPPPELPLDVFPDLVQQYAQSVANDTHTPPDYAAASCLAAAATAIGTTVRGVIKGEWSEQPALWIALVGEASEKKTPNAKGPLKQVNRENKIRIKRYCDRVKDTENAGGSIDTDEPYRNNEGAVVINTCTVEGLAKLFGKQKRGVLYTRSELTGWLRSFGQYKGGAGDDRQVFIELFDGSSVYVLRAGESVRIDGPCLNIFGGVQPSVMADFIEARDGLDARFLWVYPKSRVAVPEDFVTVNATLQSKWDATIERLFALEPVEYTDQFGEAYFGPRYLQLDESGRQAWTEYTAWGAEVHNNRDTPDKLREWVGKHEGFGMRIAVVLRMLHEACGNRRHDAPITAEDVNAAAKLVRYFAETTRRILSIASSNEDVENAKVILRAIQESKVTEFTRTDLMQRRLRRHFDLADDMIPALKVLIDRKIIRYATGDSRKTTRYEVNPNITPICEPK